MTDPNDLSSQLVSPGAGSAPRKEGRRSVLRKIAGRTVPTQVEQVHGPNGQPCLLVVERLPREAGLTDEQAAALVREARAASTLHHPNIVRGRAVSVRADEIVVATDYVEGELLSELWRTLAAVGSSLPPDIAIRVLIDVLSGLDALHGFSDAKGVVLRLIHGEVTAANVLIGRDGNARLLHASRIRRPGLPSVTDAGAIAPEIIARAPADHRADVFSVGVLLWQALSGVPALIDATDADLVTRIRAGTVERAPAPKGARWGAALVDIAKRAMAPSAKDRYESAAAMAADLRKAIGDELPGAVRVAQYLKANMGEKNDAVQKPSQEARPAAGLVTGAHRVAVDTPKAVVPPKQPTAPAPAAARNVPTAPQPSSNVKPATPSPAAAVVAKRTAPTPALGSKVLAPSASSTLPGGAPKPPPAPAQIAAPKPPPAPVPSITAPKPPPAPAPQITAPKPPPAPTPPAGIKPAAQVSRAPAAPPAPPPARSLSKTMIGGVTAPVGPVLKPPPAPVARPVAPAKPAVTPTAQAPAPVEAKQPPARMATLIGPMSPFANAPSAKPPPAPVAAKPAAAAHAAPIAKAAPPPNPPMFPPSPEREVPARKPPPKTNEAVSVSNVLEIDTFPRIPVAGAVTFTPPVSEHPVPQEPKVVIASTSTASKDEASDRDSAPPSSSGAPTPRFAKSVVDEPTVLLPRTRLGDLDPEAPPQNRARRSRTIVGTVAAACLVIMVLAGLQLKRKGEPARAAAPIPTATIETPAPRHESPPPTPTVQTPPPTPTAAIATVATPPPSEPPAAPPPAFVPEPEPAPRATHGAAPESPSLPSGSRGGPVPAIAPVRPPKPAVDVLPNEPPQHRKGRSSTRRGFDMLSSARTLRTWIAAGCVGGLLAFSPMTSLAAGAEPSVATQAQKSDAQKRFDRGRDLAQANRHADALVEFKASYEIVASPNTHFSIARTLANLGQRAEAYAEFGKTLVEAQAAAPKDKRYVQTAEACETEQRDLRPKLAFLAIVVDHGDNATVKVAEREYDRSAIAGLIPVSPGPVIVTVSNGGVEVGRQALTLTAGDQKTVTFDAQPKTPDAAPVVVDSTPTEQPIVAVDTSPGGLRTAAYVAGGVGVVGLATFAIFGALEKSKYNDLQDACHGGPCPPERADDISAGRSRQTIANVGLGLGLAGAVAGVVLFVVSAPPKTPSSTTASIVVSPGFVGVGGTL